jgi:tripartite-type tricarboxylate transporter receptor subunit TctC
VAETRNRTRIALVVLVLAAPAAMAQSTFPSKPLRIIIPFTPGGSTDFQGRWSAQQLSVAFNQPVVPENRPGAGGVPGSDAGAKAAPDGYTLLAGNPGPLTISPSLLERMPYDTVRDYAPIFLITKSPICVCVHPSVPAKSLAEFISLAKSQDGKLNYGSAGVGTAGHIATEQLASRVGIKMTHIPYKGSAQFSVDIVNGTLDATLSFFTSALPLIKSGKVRPLAVTTLARHPLLPELPTVAELGFPGFESVGWNGVLAPAGTPRPIIVRMHDILAKALATPEARELFIAQGNEIAGLNPEQYGAFLKTEIEQYAQVAKAAGIPKQAQ